MNIDETKAGPELDKLACEALGIASVPYRVCTTCGYRTEQSDDDYRCCSSDQRLIDRFKFPAISTNPTALIEALSRLAWCIITPPSASPHVRAYWTVEMERKVGDGEVTATGSTMMEAFAKAAAKVGLR